MARIKVTGYIDSEDLDPEDVDLSDPTGFSEEGHLKHVVGEDGRALALTDLEDVDTEVVE